jgi:hypothetical protein
MRKETPGATGQCAAENSTQTRLPHHSTAAADCARLGVSCVCMVLWGKRVCRARAETAEEGQALKLAE